MAYKPETQDIPSDTVVHFAAAIRIETPAKHAFEVLLNTSKWPEWNSFMPAATLDDDKAGGVLRPGVTMTEHVRMSPTSSLRRQQVFVTEVTQNPDVNGTTGISRVCWKAVGLPQFILRTMRTNDFRVLDDGAACEFVSIEVMAGPAAYAVKAMYGKTLQERFEEMAVDLKQYAEKVWVHQ